jgi:hypothetical protein
LVPLENVVVETSLGAATVETGSTTVALLRRF